MQLYDLLRQSDTDLRRRYGSYFSSHRLWGLWFWTLDSVCRLSMLHIQDNKTRGLLFFPYWASIPSDKLLMELKLHNKLDGSNVHAFTVHFTDHRFRKMKKCDSHRTNTMVSHSGKNKECQRLSQGLIVHLEIRSKMSDRGGGSRATNTNARSTCTLWEIERNVVDNSWLKKKDRKKNHEG